jgi:hypothetical protein
MYTQHQLPYCKNVLNHIKSQLPFQTLPKEYPLLSLIPFSLPLLIGVQEWYPQTFAIIMLSFALITYYLLKRYKSSKAARMYALFLIIGGWSTTAGRFDLFPSLLTLVALLLAEKRHWNWAFLLLAGAGYSKLYPFILLPPFLIAQQMQRTAHRFLPPLIFSAAIIVLGLLSLGINTQTTLGIQTYHQSRPLQIESLWASILWILQPVIPLKTQFSYGSLNVISPLTPTLNWIYYTTSIAALLWILFLQLYHKVTLPQATVLTIMVFVTTNKVLSPQYLLWITPLLVYALNLHFNWEVSWIAISALTTLIYPFFYRLTHPLLTFSPQTALNATIFLRNLSLLAFTLSFLYFYTSRPWHHK